MILLHNYFHRFSFNLKDCDHNTIFRVSWNKYMWLDFIIYFFSVIHIIYFLSSWFLLCPQVEEVILRLLISDFGDKGQRTKGADESSSFVQFLYVELVPLVHTDIETKSLIIIKNENSYKLGYSTRLLTSTRHFLALIFWMSILTVLQRTGTHLPFFLHRLRKLRLKLATNF